MLAYILGRAAKLLSLPYFNYTKNWHSLKMRKKFQYSMILLFSNIELSYLFFVEAKKHIHSGITLPDSKPDSKNYTLTRLNLGI